MIAQVEKKSDTNKKGESPERPKTKLSIVFVKKKELGAESADQKAGKGKKSVAFKLFGRINFKPKT